VIVAVTPRDRFELYVTDSGVLLRVKGFELAARHCHRYWP